MKLRRAAVFAAVAAAFHMGQLLQAQTTNTWDGGGANGLFSTAVNWLGDVLPPGTNNLLIFDGAAGGAITNNNVITNFAATPGSPLITFTANAGAYTLLSSNALTFTHAANYTMLAQQSANNQVIAANLTFAGGTRDHGIVFTNGAGSVTFSGNVNFNNSYIYLGTNTYGTNAGTIVLSGTNTGDGRGSTIIYTNVGVATNQLRATVLATGIDGSIVQLGSDRALGNPSTALNNLRGIYASRTTTLMAVGTVRNLSDYYVGSAATKFYIGGSNNLTIGGYINNAIGGSVKDWQIIAPITVTVASNYWMSATTNIATTNYVYVTNGASLVVNGKVNDTFHPSGLVAGTTNLVRKAGEGIMELNADNSATYTGNLKVEGGVLRLGNPSALGATNTSSYVSITTGTLDLNGQTTGKKIWSDNAAAVIANSSAASAALSGDIGLTASLIFSNTGHITVTRISGAGGVTKLGSGTLTMSGNGTYAGKTAVTAGTLIVNGDNSSATNEVAISAGATLAGSGTIGGNTTIDGILSPGSNSGGP